MLTLDEAVDIYRAHAARMLIQGSDAERRALIARAPSSDQERARRRIRAAPAMRPRRHGVTPFPTHQGPWLAVGAAIAECGRRAGPRGRPRREAVSPPHRSVAAGDGHDGAGRPWGPGALHRGRERADRIAGAGRGRCRLGSVERRSQGLFELTDLERLDDHRHAQLVKAATSGLTASELPCTG